MQVTVDVCCTVAWPRRRRVPLRARPDAAGTEGRGSGTGEGTGRSKEEIKTSKLLFLCA